MPHAFAAHVGTSDQWPAALSLVLRLLHDARQALGSNTDEAHHCIEQAAALLRAESSFGDARPATPRIPTRGQLATWQVTRVAAFVDANLTAKLGNEDLAAVARLSTSHFARAFRSTVGMTPHAYVMRRRIARAQEMIRLTDKPLSEVAFDCGLADQAHLTRLFRRGVGASPSAWRRLHGVAPDVAARGEIAGPRGRAPVVASTAHRPHIPAPSSAAASPS